MTGRILLLSADFGSGHLQAALAVAQAVQALDRDVVVRAVNVEGRVANLFSAGYTALLSRAPSAWRSLYRAPVISPLRRLIRTAYGGAVRREVRAWQPTAVVATHPFPGAAAAAMRRNGELSAPLITVLTDFAPHGLWVNEGVDRYMVASAEAGAGLQRLGVCPARILVTGIPIRPEFVLPAAASRQREARVLVMGGGLGLGPITEAVGSLIGLPGTSLPGTALPGTALPENALQITVVCGQNDRLQQELIERFGHDPRVLILGFTRRVAQLMAEADLLVTKPGGITASEALAVGLPMLLLPPLPGHEEENAAALCRTGGAHLVEPAQTGPAAANLLHTDRATLDRMRASCRQAGRPDSAQAIANQIFTCASPDRLAGATA